MNEGKNILRVSEFAPYRALDEGFNISNAENTLQSARNIYNQKQWLDTFDEYERFIEGILKIPDSTLLPLKELMKNVQDGRRVISLRYDVDIDPCTAVRLARYNSRYGICGTFYLLHTAYYYGTMHDQVFCRNPILLKWVMELVVAGCEIGLHIDPLSLYFQYGVDGAAAICEELSWLRSQGAVICGTVAHNSYPLYGAENFEIFKNRVVWKRSSLTYRGRKVPLGILDEAELGLSYEGNYSVTVAKEPTRQILGKLLDWSVSPMTDAVADEYWMRMYLLDNPYFQSACKVKVWHHGGGKWTVAANIPGERLHWMWCVSLDDMLFELQRLPEDSRIMIMLHPVYFSGDQVKQEENAERMRLEESDSINYEDVKISIDQLSTELRVIDRKVDEVNQKIDTVNNLLSNELNVIDRKVDAVNNFITRIETRLGPGWYFLKLPFCAMNWMIAFVYGIIRKIRILLRYCKLILSGFFRILDSSRKTQDRRGKKVLMLTTSQIHIDPRINKVAQALARHAYEVDILCFQEDTTHTNISEELITASIRYVRVPPTTNHKFDGQFFQNSFVKTASSRKFDYVHANDLPTLMSAWYLSRKFGVPLIYDAHEMWTENVWLKKNEWGPMPWYAHVLTRVLESFLVRYVDLFMSVSHSICHEFKKRYRLKERPLLLANFPEIEMIEATSTNVSSIKETCGLSQEHFVTLYLGGVNPLRNIENVIKAHQYLPERFAFVIRGPSVEYYESHYLEQARALGLEGRIFTVAPVERERVLEGAYGADCGIVMLKNICKNFYWFYPNKFFEYMAAKMPVAVSNFPDVTAHVEKERCGVTFDPNDPESIASAIRFLGDNPEEARAMGRRGYESILREYNWESVIEPFLEAYDRL